MIRLMEDVVSPLAVAAVNIVGRTSMPDYHDYLVYGMTAIGYGMAFMGKGGDLVKNIGLSSLPLTADKLYERFRTTPVARQTSPVTRRAPIRQTPGPGFAHLETW